uniref:Uncharacterized protein n=1 Tax=Anguilla anguilla TaxID=7936 RepID=A0A0E9PP88_ANGAN
MECHLYHTDTILMWIFCTVICLHKF